MIQGVERRLKTNREKKEIIKPNLKVEFFTKATSRYDNF
jgi:hypothetical protein